MDRTSGSPVSLTASGKLAYQTYTNRGDVIMDFSYAGYKASEEPIPFVRVVERLDPIPWKGQAEGTMAYPDGPDSHERIQSALDRVAALEPDANGFRGAVFLSKGTYYLKGGLKLKSGVILRGEGERDFGTELIFYSPDGVAITIGSIDADSPEHLVSMAGLEGMSITSNYDKAFAENYGTNATLSGSPANLSLGVRILNAENVWVRGCRLLHTANGAVRVENSRNVTIRDNEALRPVPKTQGDQGAVYSSLNSSMLLFYHCVTGEARHDFTVGSGFIQSSASPLESTSLFEQQLIERIGERQAKLVLAETLSKASLPMKLVFPRPVMDGIVQGPKTEEQLAFETADARPWKVVMEDEGTQDWKAQWFLDGEGQTSVTNTPEGMALKAKDGHMVLWTKESFEGDLKIEYTFTRTDVDGGGVCIIYIQATGRGDKGYETDITEWNDYRKDASMGHYFRNMHLYHVSYACGYVRGRRYNPEERKMNTYSELTPEYLVDNQDFFEPGVPYRITFIKTDKAIRMKAIGPEKALYFMLNNENWPAVTEGRIGLRQMQSRESIYKDFKISVPE